MCVYKYIILQYMHISIYAQICTHIPIFMVHFTENRLIIHTCQMHGFFSDHWVREEGQLKYAPKISEKV